jgi:hypothetical protein
MSQIILWKNTKGLYSKLQKWFSGYPYSHTAIYLGRLLDEDWVYEAGFSLSANPVDLRSPNIEIWHCNLYLEDSLKKVIKKVNGKPYAFLQILYFVRRKLYEEIPLLWKIIQKLHPNVKHIGKLNNWFPRSQICTEFWYDVMKGASYTEAHNLYKYLDDTFDGNNLYVSDVLKTMQLFPEYFEKINED